MHGIALDLQLQDSTFIDLLGFIACIVIALVFLVADSRAHQIRNEKLLPLFLLVGYIYVVDFFTGDNKIIIYRIIGRSSILVWVLCGMGAALSLHRISKWARFVSQRGTSRLKPITSVALLALVGCAAYAREFIGQTVNYQPIAYSAMVLIIIATLTLLAESGGRQTKVYNFLLLLGSLSVTVSVAMLQSTSIVAFFGIFLLVYVWYFIARQERHYSIIVLCLVIYLLIAIPNNDWMARLVLETRFNTVLEGNGQLRSVETRLELLPTFAAQFNVAPFFGHSEAELVSGIGEGNYLHSVVLSMLTHNGVVGTLCFAQVMFKYVKEANDPAKMNALRQCTKWFLVLSVTLGAFMTFYTWPVLWFLLGMASGLAAIES
jgi:hypothetical protein